MKFPCRRRRRGSSRLLPAGAGFFGVFFALFDPMLDVYISDVAAGASSERLGSVKALTRGRL